MTNDERIQKRIQRDKCRRSKKRLEKQQKYGDFEKVFTMQNFLSALSRCQKNVSWKGSVQSYSKHCVVKMKQAKDGLMDGKLNTSKNIRQMVLYERGKRREINAIRIDDRHIQRVLCDECLIPSIGKSLIYDNGASTYGKGVEFARRRLNTFLEKAVRKYGDDFYVLTFDIKSFFDSILHRVCMEELNRYFTDKRIIGLAMKIIKMYQEYGIKKNIPLAAQAEKLDILKRNQGIGITLGSQVSQVMALLVPNRADHFIKDVLGARMFIRYMDDGIIIHKSKEYLQEIVNKINYIFESIGLHLNMKKTHIAKCTRGFKFMKVRYCIKDNKIIKTIDKSGIVCMRRKLKRFSNLVDNGKMTVQDVYNAMQSWTSHSKIAKAYHARRNMIQRYRSLFGDYKVKELIAL